MTLLLSPTPYDQCYAFGRIYGQCIPDRKFRELYRIVHTKINHEKIVLPTPKQLLSIFPQIEDLLRSLVLYPPQDYDRPGYEDLFADLFRTGPPRYHWIANPQDQLRALKILLMTGSVPPRPEFALVGLSKDDAFRAEGMRILREWREAAEKTGKRIRVHHPLKHKQFVELMELPLPSSGV